MSLSRVLHCTLSRSNSGRPSPPPPPHPLPQPSAQCPPTAHCCVSVSAPPPPWDCRVCPPACLNSAWGRTGSWESRRSRCSNAPYRFRLHLHRFRCRRSCNALDFDSVSRPQKTDIVLDTTVRIDVAVDIHDPPNTVPVRRTLLRNGLDHAATFETQQIPGPGGQPERSAEQQHHSHHAHHSTPRRASEHHPCRPSRRNAASTSTSTDTLLAQPAPTQTIARRPHPRPRPPPRPLVH